VNEVGLGSQLEGNIPLPFRHYSLELSNMLLSPFAGPPFSNDEAGEPLTHFSPSGFLYVDGEVAWNVEKGSATGLVQSKDSGGEGRIRAVEPFSGGEPMHS